MGLLGISRAFFFFLGEALCIVILISRGSSFVFVFFRACRIGLRMNET